MFGKTLQLELEIGAAEPVWVSLRDGTRTFVDGDWARIIIGESWRVGHDKRGRPYVRRCLPGGQIAYLHRLIANAGPGSFVDHINGNSLDNRRANLRLCGNAQNAWNRGPSKRSPTKYKGVFRSHGGKWNSKIMVNGKRIDLGQFATPEEAARAYNDAARKHYGEFAYINEVA